MHSNYQALYFDNLARTASLLESLMDQIDEGDAQDLLPSFEAVTLERKQTIDERAVSLRTIEDCRKKIEEQRNLLNTRIRQIKELQATLKKKTLETMQSFENQPFRGQFLELKTRKTAGKVELEIHTQTASVQNAITADQYAQTDIPLSCLKKVVLYQVDKKTLGEQLKKGLVIKDAKLTPGKSLTIKDL